MRFTLFTLLAVMTLSAPAQTPKIGSHLLTEYRKLEKPYFFKAPESTPWAEGKGMLLIGDKPNLNESNYLFLALQDTTLIGVFLKSVPVFLFDTEGNAVLNTPSKFFMLPAWTVQRKTKINPSDKTALNLLDQLYEQTFQANDGMPEATTLRNLQRFRSDTTLANRHLILLFDNYQTIIDNTAAIGKKPPADLTIPSMKTLAAECIDLYGRIPPLVCIYLGEALFSAGETEAARNHFKMALQLYPDSIPLQVYDYRLEPDAAKQNQLLASLKKNHPQHWMVKDL